MRRTSSAAAAAELVQGLGDSAAEAHMPSGRAGAREKKLTSAFWLPPAIPKA